MLTDLHFHTILSKDCSVPLPDMVRAGVEAGVSSMIVTDHYDMLSSDGKPDLSYDWTPSFHQFSECQSAFGASINLGLGIELGSAPFFRETAAEILAQAGDSLDFVIGSLHNYRPENGGGEYYRDCFDSDEKCRFALNDYLTSMAELAAIPECYDVLGHIIYPLRYFSRDGHPTTLDPYRDRLADILRLVIDNGRGIEINTNRGKSIEDWRDILLLYKDLGGTLVTTGSDAHCPEDVAKGIPSANELLLQCGFTRIAYYNRREPELINIR